GANARVAGTDWAFLSGGEALLSERDLFDASDRLAVQQLGGQTRLFQYDAFDHVVSALDIEGQPLANLTQIEARAAPIANLSALVEAELGILRAVASAASPARRFDYTLDGGGNRLASSSQVGSSPPILREFA